MDLGEEVVRLREKLDGLSKDFGMALQSFTSLQTALEEDLDKIEARVEKLREDGHGLDKRVTVMEQKPASDVSAVTAQVNALAKDIAVISAMLEEAKNGRYDITGAFRTHRADGASDPQPAEKDESAAPDWASIIRDASTKWGPALAAVAALILALLQQCGVVAPPPPPAVRQEPTTTTSAEPH